MKTPLIQRKNNQNQHSSARQNKTKQTKQGYNLTPPPSTSNKLLAQIKLAQEKKSRLTLNPPVQQKTNKDLPPAVQAKMENTMGHDFSNVKIHQNSKKAVNSGAKAYAQGNNVHFAPGQFKPETSSGQELIGHELTHIVQQREGRVKPTKMLGKGMPVNDDPKLEKEADVIGKKAAQAKISDSTSQLKENTGQGIMQGSWLDWVQGGLDVVGLIPGVGEIADGANALISLGRGDYAGAALSAGAMVPFAGWGATAAKTGRNVSNIVDATKTVDKASDAVRTADKVGDVTKTTSNAATAAKTTDAQKSYQTYTKTHPETGVVYSGRTSGVKSPQKNIKARDRYHHMNEKGFSPAELDLTSLNKDAIRGREQINIERHGGAQSQGGTSGNAINGVGSKNKRAEQYRKAAEKEFGIK